MTSADLKAATESVTASPSRAKALKEEETKDALAQMEEKKAENLRLKTKLTAKKNKNVKLN